MKIHLTCVGTRPLLMHNIRLASPFDPYARQLKALNSKRNKTEEDRMEVARVEFEGSLYYDEELGPYLPGGNLFMCLIHGGRQSKSGKKVERGIVVTDFQLPLLYDGPRTIPDLWGSGTSRYVDIRSVTVGGSKIDRCRPIFHQWSLETDLLLDPQFIELEEFERIAETSGLIAGLGDYRLLYGRFLTEVTVL